MLANRFAQLLNDSHQTPGTFPPSRAFDRPLRQQARRWFGKLNDAKASAAQGGINPENDLMTPVAGLSCLFENRSSGATNAAHPFFQLFKISRTDAHEPNRAKASPFAKAQRSLYRSQQAAAGTGIAPRFAARSASDSFQSLRSTSRLYERKWRSAVKTSSVMVPSYP